MFLGSDFKQHLNYHPIRSEVQGHEWGQGLELHVYFPEEFMVSVKGMIIWWESKTKDIDPGTCPIFLNRK